MSLRRGEREEHQSDDFMIYDDAVVSIFGLRSGHQLTNVQSAIRCKL